MSSLHRKSTLGKEKEHKYKQFFQVNDGGGSRDRVGRGLQTGGQGSKVYVLCPEPKEHKHFRPGTRPGGSGTRPGGSVTGVTGKLFYVPNVYVPFPAPSALETVFRPFPN